MYYCTRHVRDHRVEDLATDGVHAEYTIDRRVFLPMNEGILTVRGTRYEVRCKISFQNFAVRLPPPGKLCPGILTGFHTLAGPIRHSPSPMGIGLPCSSLLFPALGTDGPIKAVNDKIPFSVVWIPRSS